MRTVIAMLFCFILSFSTNSYSQSSGSMQDLKDIILNGKSDVKKMSIDISTAKSNKSPALALILSFVLPGAGHFYIDRMDVGKYFLGVDAASWVGLVSMNIYGNSLRDDSRHFSKQHAGVANIDSKPDDFFTNIGNYSNVYEYNNDKLIRGEYALLYNVNDLYWNWDNTDNRGAYETQRKSSERIYNSRIIFGSLLIANRIVSGISAYLLTNNENKAASLNVVPELMYKSDYTFDGLKINISKNF